MQLSEPVSAQATGVVLVWSAYADQAAQTYDTFSQFIPKGLSDGQGVSSGVMLTASGSMAGSKYVYVNDDRIAGNANNSSGERQVASGLVLSNNHWALTRVLGV